MLSAIVRGFRTPRPQRLGWHRSELAVWDRFVPKLTERLAAAAAASSTIMIFDVRGGSVSTRDKGNEWPPIPHAQPFYDMMRFRAEAYRRFIEESLARFGSAGDGTIAVDVGDLADHEANLPIFCFQKRDGSTRLMLPDLDSVVLAFYEQPEFLDRTAFDGKAAQGIFVGSTTGSLPLSGQDVEEGRNERIRSALYFRDRHEVDFFLPAIVQCDSGETVALIESLGIGGTRLTWQEQLRYRYLLSLDGNGATCSRVAIALRSRSVLVKYRSPYQLHYFKGLADRENIVSVTDEVEADAWIASATDHEETDRAIAANATTFAIDNLSRIHMMRYTADLLNGYLAVHGEVRTSSPPAPFVIDAAGRFDDGTCCWADPAGRIAAAPGARLTGFSLYVDHPLVSRDFETVLVDDLGERHVIAGCGPNDVPEGRHVRALQIRQRGWRSWFWRLSATALHVDGRASPATGKAAFRASDAAIIAVTMTVKSRSWLRAMRAISWLLPWRVGS